MRKHIELARKNESGFTLVELLVVMLILSVLAAIAIPVFLNQQKSAERASLKSDVRNTVTSVSGSIAEAQAGGTLASVTTPKPNIPGYIYVTKVVDDRNYVLIEGTADHFYVYGGVRSGGKGWYFNSKTGSYKDWDGTHYAYS